MSVLLAPLLLASLPAHASEKRVLAVLELRNKLKPPDSEQIDAAYLTDQLRAAALKAVPHLAVITRENMLVLLRASGKELADCEGECEVDTGRRLGADLVLSGEVLKFGTRYKLSLRLHDTAGGQLLAGSSASGKTVDELDDATAHAIAELFAPLIAATCRDAQACIAKCDAGDAPGCLAAAKFLDERKGLLRDAPRALKLIRRACDLGDPGACLEAGLRTAHGSGAAPDPETIETLFNQACSKGEQRACKRDPHEGCAEKLVRTKHPWEDHLSCWFVNACRYGDGAGCRKDCDAGNLDSCYVLGEMHWNGQGVEKGLPLAETVWKRACEAGHALACSHEGYATRPYEERALAAFERGCALGSPEGCVNAGERLWNWKREYPASVARYRKACEGGNPIGCESLGLAYRDGVSVPKDASKAAEFYSRACDAGRSGSCFELGALLAGPLAAQERAAELFALACEWGEQRGCERAKK